LLGSDPSHGRILKQQQILFKDGINAQGTSGTIHLAAIKVDAASAHKQRVRGVPRSTGDADDHS
jgi:hypothetical protein